MQLWISLLLLWLASSRAGLYQLCDSLQGGQWYDRCRAPDGEGEAEPILCALCSEAQELQGHQQQEDPARHVGQGCLQVHCASGMLTKHLMLWAP